MSPRNPFEYGRELDRAELVDRLDELARLDATIRNRARLFLIGPRRFGKTSLLAAADQAATARGVIVLRFDAEKYETLELLARAILTTAARRLNTSSDRLVELLAAVASALRPRLEIGPDGASSVTFGVDPTDHGELPLLTDALDAVDGMAERTGRETVLILDEIQEVVVEHGPAAERQLRATVQGHRHVAYVFAGSSVRLLTAMTEDANRPFYRMGERLFLHEIPRADFRDFLAESFEATGFPPTASGCEAILERAREVPYNVQRLAHEVWELLRAGEAERLDPETVAEALRRIVIREDPAYTQVWSALSRNQKKALKAVLEQEGEGLLASSTARRYALPASSMQAALAALEDRHLVRRDHRAGDVRYRLVDPFLGAWLKEVQSL